MPEPTYALQVNDESSRLPDYPFIDEALVAAVAKTVYGATVTLLRVDGDDDLVFTPLCLISPVVAS